MSVQTLYVSHTAGTVLGSHTRSPWVAASAAQAAQTAWDGQPVFTDRVQAFAWLDTVRADVFRWLDFAVARVDADTYPDPSGPPRGGPHRGGLAGHLPDRLPRRGPGARRTPRPRGPYPAHRPRPAARPGRTHNGRAGRPGSQRHHHRGHRPARARPAR